MKNFSIILALAAVLLLVVGCGQQSTTGGQAFLGGNVGLQSSFLDGTPPPEVFDGGNSPFSIVVQLQNVGESGVKANSGYVQINGLEPGTFGVSTFKKAIAQDIRGTTKNFDGSIIPGGIFTVEFNDLKYENTLVGNIVYQMSADVCYKYATNVTSQLCVKKDPQLLVNDNKICDVEGEKGAQNSGAPIQVTSLKENFAGNGKIGVTIVIAHKGTGDNFFKDSETVCNDVVSNNQRSKVHVIFHAVRIGGRDIYPECFGLSDQISTHEGYVRLFDKTGSSGASGSYSLYCTIDASTTDSIFEVPINLDLSYLYLQHMDKTLTVRHVAQ